MPEYGPEPLPYVSGVPLGVAYTRFDPTAAGGIATISYWNHADGGYEAGPRVTEKHVLPLARVAATGVDNDQYLLFVAKAPVQSASSVVTVYELTSAGQPSKTREIITRNQARILAGFC